MRLPWNRRKVAAVVTLSADGNWYQLAVRNPGRRPTWITHVWFDGDPHPDSGFPAGTVAYRVDAGLPADLQPGAVWHTSVPANLLEHVHDVERAGRVRLSAGRVVRSQPAWRPRSRGWHPGATSTDELPDDPTTCGARLQTTVCVLSPHDADVPHEGGGLKWFTERPSGS